MRVYKKGIALILAQIFCIGIANAQFGNFKKKLNKAAENVNKAKTTKEKISKLVVPSLSAFPAFVKTAAYKDQVRSSGALSRVNRLDQLIVLYLRDEAKWKAKGFTPYKGFLNSKISRIESGKKDVSEQAPTWFMLPFYTKVIRDLKSDLEAATIQNTKSENEAEIAREQKQREDKLAEFRADSTNYVTNIDAQFNQLKVETPVEEAKIVSNVHKENVGKIVFSKSDIPLDAPSASQLTTSFTSNDQIFMRAYLSQAVQNMNFNPDNPAKDSYKDIILNPEDIYLKVFVDGKEMGEQLGLSNTMGVNKNDEVAALSFATCWHREESSGRYRNLNLIKFMRKLPKGKHTVRVEGHAYARLNFEDPDLMKESYFEEDYEKRKELIELAKAEVEMKTKTPIFKGEFTINIIGLMASGIKWKNVIPGKLDANSSLKSILKKTLINDGVNLKSFRILEDDYSMIRNEYSGAVLSRYVTVMVAYKEDGLMYSCRYVYKQTFDGLKFQKTWIRSGYAFKNKLIDY